MVNPQGDNTVFKRSKESSRREAGRITERDKEIVLAVYDYRALTSFQIEKLFWNGKRNSRSQLRLKFLSDLGIFDRLEIPATLSEGRKPFVYVLTSDGATLVSKMLGVGKRSLAWTVRDARIKGYFLEHLLAVNDVRIAIALSARDRGWQITKWIDDKTLKSYKEKIVPDGYFALRTMDTLFHFLLEVDRGTETAKGLGNDWRGKIKHYIDYHKSGAYEARYGTKSLRVITITTSLKRLQTLKAVTEAAGGKARFWFTTFDALTSDILTAPIWAVAGRDGSHTLIG